MSAQTNNEWPEFDLKLWKTIPVISGRIATEEEAKKGIAVFCLQNTDSEHKAVEMNLPQLAYLTDSETGNKELIVAIQAEATTQGIVVGYRNPKGGNGACLFYELTFLSEMEIPELE